MFKSYQLDKISILHNVRIVYTGLYDRRKKIYYKLRASLP